MNDPKSTNDIRMIAQDAIQQQEQICQARRDNLEDKLASLAETVSTNAVSIATLTQSMAALAQSIATMAATVQAFGKTTATNETDIDALKTNVTRLKGRPAIWALIGSAIGSGVPITVGFLFWWMNR